MSDVLLAGGWGLLVALSLIVGALIAARLQLPARLAALITAFGGGILLAAVALELVPEADARSGSAWTVTGLMAGAIIYVAADALLARDERRSTARRSAHASASGMPMAEPKAEADAVRGESIAAGIVVDGIPESLALGLMAVERGSGLALLVAVVVGNLTEAYGAAQPIIAGGRSRRFAVVLLTCIALLLGAVTVLGGLAGSALGDTAIGATQAVAAGAVVAVVSISIFPYAFETANRKVALATALGFAIGYLLSG